MGLIDNYNFEINWVTINRIFRVANKFLELGGELDEFELNSYRFMYSQCDDLQKQHLQKHFGDLTGHLKFMQ